MRQHFEFTVVIKFDTIKENIVTQVEQSQTRDD